MLQLPLSASLAARPKENFSRLHSIELAVRVNYGRKDLNNIYLLWMTEFRYLPKFMHAHNFYNDLNPFGHFDPYGQFVGRSLKKFFFQ